MDPMTLMLLTMLPEVAKAGYGIYQNAQSAKYANTKRPPYEIPQSETDMLNLAKSLATQTQLPGQGLAEEKLNAATSAGINAAMQSTDSPANTLGMVASLVGKQQGNIRDMTESAATNYDTHQNSLMTALASMATEEGKKWQWDKAQPYLSAMETAKNLQTSGTQNIMTGLEGVTNAALAGQYLKYMSGKTTDPTGSGIKDATDYLKLLNPGDDLNNSFTPGETDNDMTSDYLSNYKMKVLLPKILSGNGSINELADPLGGGIDPMSKLLFQLKAKNKAGGFGEFSNPYQFDFPSTAF